MSVIADLRASADARGLAVGAVAIGMPGFLHPVTRLVVGGVNLGWHGYRPVRPARRRVPEPYAIENDVNLAALGEARVGAGRGVAGFVTVSIGTGLGGAVVVDGHLLRGRSGGAGEFGYLLADRQQLRRPGGMGMESRVAGQGSPPAHESGERTFPMPPPCSPLPPAAKRWPSRSSRRSWSTWR